MPGRDTSLSSVVRHSEAGSHFHWPHRQHYLVSWLPHAVRHFGDFFNRARRHAAGGPEVTRLSTGKALAVDCFLEAYTLTGLAE